MKDERIIDYRGKVHAAPEGTLSDLMFLVSCGIEPWSSFGMITFVIGECPWREPGGMILQCDRDRHQWDGEKVRRLGEVQDQRTCSKCDAIEDPL